MDIRKWEVRLAVFAACVGFLLFGISCAREKTRLPTPINLVVNGSVLTWDEVENASGYVVSAGGKEYETEECRYDLSALEEGVYTIRVLAAGDWKKYRDSGWASIRYKVEKEREEPEEPEEEEKATEGLAYRFIGTGYEVSKGSADLRGRVVIPDLYRNVPVIRIADRGFGVDALQSLTGGVQDKTTSVRLPSRLKEIGQYAFEDCIALEEIEIPEGVEEIGSRAFSYCENLTRIELPAGVKIIGAGAFAGCAITDFKFPEGMTEIPESLLARTKLTQIEIPDTVKTIGYSAFINCDFLTEIRIPEGVESIEQSAFGGCDRLAKISLPKSLIFLGEAFDNTEWLQKQGEFAVLRGDILYKYKGTEKELNGLPPEIKYVACGAFSGLEKLEKVSIQDGVELWSDSLFSGCEALKEVRLPEGMTEIGRSMFSRCKELERIELPEGITEIGNSAFFRCEKLKGILFPDTLRKIGNTVFTECYALERLEIPEGVEEIGLGAFQVCQGLKEIRFPKSLKTIGELAFSNCIRLETAIFAGATEFFGKGTFNYCLSLKQIYYGGTESAFASATSEGIRSDAEVYYYSEEEPKEEGKYWHWQDGEVVVWEAYLPKEEETEKLAA